MWTFFFFCCTFLVLFPALLLEFRYYLVPFLLVKLYAQGSKPKGTNANLTKLKVQGFLLPNYCCMPQSTFFTFVLFLKYPFVWSNGE